jgi:hypothetical protein
MKTLLAVAVAFLLLIPSAACAGWTDAQRARLDQACVTQLQDMQEQLFCLCMNEEITKVISFDEFVAILESDDKSKLEEIAAPFVPQCVETATKAAEGQLSI